ncbi:MAG: hypothetical protein GX295_11725 [Syntrophomonadaceae bacterium]|nr:hypothetical protein [Syntrophomonadaceae bacterium]
MFNINPSMFWAMLISLIIGIMAIALAYLVLNQLGESLMYWLTRDQRFSKKYWKQKVAAFLKSDNETYDNVRNLFTLGGGALGVFTVLFTIPTNGMAMMWFGTIGAVAGYIFSYIIVKSFRHKRLREIAYFYEAMFIYVKHYNLYDVVQLSGMLVPGIYPYIQKCLLSWSKEGFIELQKDLGDSNEAKMLASVLIQLYEKGHKDLREVINQEGKKLEEIRAVLVETENELKPMYQAVNLALPALAFFSLLIMPWMHLLADLISSISIDGSNLQSLPKLPFIRFLQ